jgi:hypothetical protein
MKSQNKKVQELTAEGQEVVISTNWSNVGRALIKNDGYSAATR